MGADGGVVYIPLKYPSVERYTRVCALLQPFWQFLSRNDGAYWAEDANWKWEEENNIGSPNYILGYYGTDRCDNFSLGDLTEICSPFEDERDYLLDLTFDELDLDCRTSPFPIINQYGELPLHCLWASHFRIYSREETLEQLGPLASLKIKDWVQELHSLLDITATVHEETWT